MASKLDNYTISRLAVGFIWLYHGIMPKLLGPHPNEIAMSLAAGFSESQAVTLAMAAGIVETGFGVILLLLWRQRWPLMLSGILMIPLLLFAVGPQPAIIFAAFNPVTTNISVLALSLIAYRLHGKVD